MANPVERLYPEGAADPFLLHSEAAGSYYRWAKKLAEGGGLPLPWGALQNLVGPLLPGWLVLIGARAKHGKSTILRAVFDCWVSDFKKKVLYVGTEQDAGILCALWACLRLRVSPDAAIDPSHPDHAAVMDDVRNGQLKDGLSERAIIVSQPSITISDFKRWMRYGYRNKCDATMLDHFHRMEDDGASQSRSRNSQIRDMKNMAADSGMLVVAAAQLKNGAEKGALGEYEVPGSDSWAESSGLRREADVAIQAWRPFVPGVTRAQKSDARDDPEKLREILQPNTMTIRCDAHRYRQVDPYQAARLRVRDGELTGWLPELKR